MPEWEGPPTLLPDFSGAADDGTPFRLSDWRQFHHMVVVFAEDDSPAVRAVLDRAGALRENDGRLVIVCPPGAPLTAPPGVPVVRDTDGGIAARYRALMPDWRPPFAFVADRYSEIMATTPLDGGAAAERIEGWLFSAEVQCNLCSPHWDAQG